MSNCRIHGYYGGPFCTYGRLGKPCDHSPEKSNYREFNADRSLGQNQYACRYIEGEHGYPKLGEGLRFKGSSDDYHQIYIHVDDYDEFHRRVLEHRAQR